MVQYAWLSTQAQTVLTELRPNRWVWRNGSA